MKFGFDKEKYMELQSKNILERVNKFEKVYLEFGGKLMNDLHAKRVLPGFDENAKIKLLQHIKEKVEVIVCVYAGDIERNKIRGDYGITYDMEVLRNIDSFTEYGIEVNSVVITRYEGKPLSEVFIRRLEMRKIKVYTHFAIKGYPNDLDKIISDDGYGINSYIETKKPIVVVTAPGPGSGKLGTCLSQIYHENKRGIEAGYAKFETFPIWNLPLLHPVNVAYESATVDLKDVNMVDSFHLEAYDKITINYNRDIEVFPILKKMLEKITKKKSIYNSPTDMGVNMAGFGIIDDELVREAGKQEIIRRYFKSFCEFKKGYLCYDIAKKAQNIMEENSLKEDDRKVVKAAKDYSIVLSKRVNDIKSNMHVVAIELHDGTMITGKTSHKMGATASALVNAIKHLAGIEHKYLLIAPEILEIMHKLNLETLGRKISLINSEQILMVISICAVNNEMSKKAMEKVPFLKECRAHSNKILNKSDQDVLNRLCIDVTCDPEYPSSNLYYA